LPCPVGFDCPAGSAAPIPRTCASSWAAAGAPTNLISLSALNGTLFVFGTNGPSYQVFSGTSSQVQQQVQDSIGGAQSIFLSYFTGVLQQNGNASYFSLVGNGYVNGTRSAWAIKQNLTGWSVGQRQFAGVGGLQTVNKAAVCTQTFSPLQTICGSSFEFAPVMAGNPPRCIVPNAAVYGGGSFSFCECSCSSCSCPAPSGPYSLQLSFARPAYPLSTVQCFSGPGQCGQQCVPPNLTSASIIGSALSLKFAGINSSLYQFSASRSDGSQAPGQPVPPFSVVFNFSSAVASASSYTVVRSDGFIMQLSLGPSGAILSQSTTFSSVYGVTANFGPQPQVSFTDGASVIGSAAVKINGTEGICVAGATSGVTTTGCAPAGGTDAYVVCYSDPLGPEKIVWTSGTPYDDWAANVAYDSSWDSSLWSAVRTATCSSSWARPATCCRATRSCGLRRSPRPACSCGWAPAPASRQPLRRFPSWSTAAWPVQRRRWRPRA